MPRRCCRNASAKASKPVPIMRTANSAWADEDIRGGAAALLGLKELVDGEPEGNQRCRGSDPGHHRALVGEPRALDSEPGSCVQCDVGGRQGIVELARVTPRARWRPVFSARGVFSLGGAGVWRTRTPASTGYRSVPRSGSRRAGAADKAPRARPRPARIRLPR